MLRRLVALVLALSFGMYYAEALIADVHDGDASASEQVQYNGASDAPHQTGVLAVHSDGPEHASPPVHATHTCHAGHAHTCMVQAIAPMSAERWLAAARVVAIVTRPIDMRQKPQLRPPIA